MRRDEGYSVTPAASRIFYTRACACVCSSNSAVPLASPPHPRLPVVPVTRIPLVPGPGPFPSFTRRVAAAPSLPAIRVPVYSFNGNRDNNGLIIVIIILTVARVTRRDTVGSVFLAITMITITLIIYRGRGRRLGKYTVLEQVLRRDKRNRRENSPPDRVTPPPPTATDGLTGAQKPDERLFSFNVFGRNSHGPRLGSLCRIVLGALILF